MTGCFGCGAGSNSSDTPGSTDASASADQDDSAYTYDGDIDYSRALAEKNQALNPGDAILTTVASDLPTAKKDYTVLIYMIGSNLESKLGNGTKDILEIADAGIDYSKNNVLLYTGGSCRWLGKIPNDRNCISDLSREAGSQIVAETEKNASMGAPECLSEFLNFAYTNYPSDHYGLILWDHGGGPLWGYGSDELFGSDSLLLSEMQTAMNNTPFHGKHKLDWVGFDACLMGSLECMSLWSDYADYYVGSEELEPGNGWDYTCFDILNSTTDAREITTHIVDSYGSYYESIRTESYNPDVTLSCIDLQNIDKAVSAMNALSSVLVKQLAQGKYSDIQKTRSETKSFGLVEGTKGEEPYYYDLVDLGDFAQKLSSDYPREGQALTDSLKEILVASTSNVNSAGGVSFYYPFKNKGQYSEMGDSYKKSADGSSTYGDFLNALADTWLTNRTHDWALESPDLKNDEFQLQLTDEQQQNSAACYYSVLKPMGNFCYSPLLTRVRIEPDNAGLLHIPTNPNIVCLATDLGEITPIPSTQIEASESRNVYRTNKARLNAGTGIVEYLTLYDEEYADTSITMSDENMDGDRLSILSVTASDNTASLGGKSTVNVSHYESVYYTSRWYIPNYDAKGNLRPYSEWDFEGTFSASTFCMDQNFGFELHPCTDMLEGCVIQVELEDTNGEFYGSALASLPQSQLYERVEETTPSGMIAYGVYEDHAVVLEYDGSDESLTIPKKIKNKPVTIIGESMAEHNRSLVHVELPDTITEIGGAAFHNCSDLENIKLPKSLKAIGNYAFHSCSAIKEFKLPASLEIIGALAFSGCSSLTELDLPKNLQSVSESFAVKCKSLNAFTLGGSKDGKAPGCQLIDGVAYSTDGRTLLAFPAGRTGSYTVEPGTETIGYAAFSSCGLTKVVLPDTLKVISNYAFRNADDLEPPVLPDSLEEIGFHAFGAGYDSIKFEEKADTIPEIHIGPRVSFIGAGAFDNFTARTFTVDPGNPFFSVKEGALCNGEGDTLTAFYMDGTPCIRYPDGITTLDFSIFSFMSSVMKFDWDSDYTLDRVDVVVPESVARIQGLEKQTTSTIGYLAIHGAPGSAIESTCLEYLDNSDESEQHMIFDNNLYPEWTEYEETTDHGTVQYRLYEDHAALVNYSGTDEVLTVPVQVKNLPVTSIGDGLNCIQETEDYDSPALTQLILPEGLLEIRSNAITYPLRLEKLELPDSLCRLESDAIGSVYYLNDEQFLNLMAHAEYLGSRCFYTDYEGEVPISENLRYLSPLAFTYCYGLTGYQENKKNTTYTVQDGFLLTADGTTLASGLTKEEDLSIPDGIRTIGCNAFESNRYITTVDVPGSVEKIARRAFAMCDELTKVTLHEGISEIGNRAFYFDENLTTIVLPEGLDTLGQSVFTKCYHLTDVRLPDTLRKIDISCFSAASLSEEEAASVVPFDTLHIGKALNSLSLNPFGGLAAKHFEVDPENTRFASPGGFLTNKAGTLLYACPSAMEGDAMIPDGVLAIGYGAFDNCNHVTDIYIPDSVISIDHSAFDYQVEYDDDWKEIGRTYPYTIHCSKGSYAEQFAIQEGIPYVAN